jgi:hypothetical protein
VDAHVHLTSLLFPQDQIEPPENPLETQCAKLCFQAMDRHRVDQCIGLIGQGISQLPFENDMQIRMAELCPERIPGVMVGFNQPIKKPWLYDPSEASAQIEKYMHNPVVKGMGEFPLSSVGWMTEWPVVWDRLRLVFDVLAKHKASCLFHTGASVYFPGESKERIRSTRGLYYANPIFIDDIACEYPEVNIIIGHVGVQASFFYGTYTDMALAICACHPNVYLETSSAPYEVLLKAVADPAIGHEKLIFGSDTPAFFNHYTAPNGEHYPTYGKPGIIGEFKPDHYKYDIPNIERLPITENEKMMILGGNITRLIKEKVE